MFYIHKLDHKNPSVLCLFRVTPNRPSNYFAKQMNPPSYNSQNKKTPLLDQTRARGEVHQQ